MADEKLKHDDKKDDKKDASTPAAETTPRPDPVGERNYAMSQPIVRPEGEGTPGAMHQTPPPAAVATTPEQVPQQVERHETDARTPTSVEEAHRRTTAPVVPAVAPVHAVVPAAPKPESAKVPEVEKPKRGARKK